MSQVIIIRRIKLVLLFSVLVVLLVISTTDARDNGSKKEGGATVAPQSSQASQPSPSGQSIKKDNHPNSTGCIQCHTNVESQHADGDAALDIGCADCHGGNPKERTNKDKAHILPKNPELWEKSGTANPERMNAMWLKESDEYIRFINPGDFRVADVSCGKCHEREVLWMKKSMMTHGGMLWGAALYNNGAYPFKDTAFGESYGVNSVIQAIFTNPAPLSQETFLKGIISTLMPLPRWEVMQPGNVLRVFERGGEKKGLPSDVGSFNSLEVPGKPDAKLSDRGYGTKLSTDPVYLGLQKTRLLDPLLSFPGTNDNPGDFRNSGCTACHIVYANDRDPKHSGRFAKFGNTGMTENPDPTIPKGQRGHPIQHKMVLAPPSSQCMTCHLHPGGNMVLGYYGQIWWDNETDGKHMYPADPDNLSPEQKDVIQQRNPEGSALRGKWGRDQKFLESIYTEINPKANRTQFGDSHGHGWIFRNVYKSDRKGNMLTASGAKIKPDDPDKFKKAVHLEDIHQKFGMHCADCHVSADVHGNGNLYNEARAAIQIDCIDCHGTMDKQASLLLTGPAAGEARFNGKKLTISKDLTKIRTRNENGKTMPMFQRASKDRPITKKNPDGKDVVFSEGEIIQNSMVEPGKWWRVVQTMDTVTQGKKDYSAASAWAKTVQRDNKTWGDTSVDKTKLAHANNSMTCYACHTSWTTSCFGCHLPMTANKQKPMLHNEGTDSLRNYTQYNFQTLRDDIFMLGKDGTVTGRRIAPTRSSCAVLVSSQNQNREWIYSQQQTVSSEGYSGHSFSTFVPHTVSTANTKVCTDCHISKANDNNAIMAQLLMQGTNFVNFMGRYVWVAAGKSIEAVIVTERDEPQAVIGSSLHRIAYPKEYAQHGFNRDKLQTAYEHPAGGALSSGKALDIQTRGEYAYVANGKGGLRVFDISNIDNKGFSERITTAPVSPFGQRLYVDTKYATGVASPSTLAVDPLRNKRPENQEAEYRDDKQPIHPIYGFLYVSDRDEGLVVVGDRKKGVVTLLDGDPLNNFLKRALAFNPNGDLKGASSITIAGVHAYITCTKGLAIINLDNPLNPKLVTIVTGFIEPRAVEIQFRYAFVVDVEGLKVVDITIPDKARRVEGAVVPFADAKGVYLARTYAYVAAGKDGIAIVDIERPEKPKVEMMFNAGGEIDDAHDIKVGMTNNSLFGYVADGHNGLRVIQLMSPEENPFIYGFSPRPTPILIATYPMAHEALAVSKGLDRDRAVDEDGNQISVFNRRGSRPFNKFEMLRMYMKDGEVFTVSNDPPRRSALPASLPKTQEETQTTNNISIIFSVIWNILSSIV